MRAPVDTIPAPPFPAKLEWINVAPLRMEKQHGRPVLVEFWDFCRAHSVRTLPYVQAWHERYAPHGLRVIGVHAPGYPPSEDPEAVRGACARLGVEHPVVIDHDFRTWRAYGNKGWPARYLFGPDLYLHSYHYGEGAYQETEQAIGELLEIEREPLAPLRPEDAPGARLVPATPEQPGAWSGDYAAGGVWAVLDGSGVVHVDGREVTVDAPGAYPLVEHERHTEAHLELEVGPGVTCHAVTFTAGVA